MTTRRKVATTPDPPTQQRFLLRAQPEVASVEKTGDRSIKGTFFTSRPVLRYDWWEDEEYELQFSADPKDWDLERVNSGVCTLLNNHYGDRLGLVTKVSIEGDQGTFEATLSRSPTGDAALKDFEDGIFGGISFGSVVGRLEEVKAAEYTGIGRNRKLVSLPIRMAKDIELLEISRADIPANPEAIARLHLEMKGLHETMTNRRTPTPQPEEGDDKDTDAEIAQLRQELAEANKKILEVTSQLVETQGQMGLQQKYTELRRKADELLAQAKISKPEFLGVFTQSATDDLVKLSEMDEGQRKEQLLGVSFWLSQCERRSPVLPLDRLSNATAPEESVEVAPGGGSTGELGKEYMSNYQPKKLY